MISTTEIMRPFLTLIVVNNHTDRIIKAFVIRDAANATPLFSPCHTTNASIPRVLAVIATSKPKLVNTSPHIHIYILITFITKYLNNLSFKTAQPLLQLRSTEVPRTKKMWHFPSTTGHTCHSSSGDIGLRKLWRLSVKW